MSQKIPKIGDLVRPTSIEAFVLFNDSESWACLRLYPTCDQIAFLDRNGNRLTPRAFPVIAVGKNKVVVKAPGKELFVLDLEYTEVVSPPAPPNKEPSLPTIEIEPKDEIETPSAPDDEMTESVAGQKLRLTNVVLDWGSKRPSVILLQQALNAAVGAKLTIDGDFGMGTNTIVRAYQKAKGLYVEGVVGGGTWAVLLNEATKKGWKPDLMLCVMEVVAWYEVGSHRNAYGMAEDDIGDGAGANYGLVQHNNYGSMRTLLNMSGRQDLLKQYNSTDKSKVNPAIKSWMGSPDGIAAQNKYFEQIIFNPSFKYVPDLGPLAEWADDATMKPYFDRLIMMLADSRVQNGGMFSSRRPFWKTLEEEYKGTPRYRELFYGKRWNKLLGEHVKYEELKERWFKTMHALSEVDNKAPETNKALIVAILHQIDDPEDQLILLAQWRARTSSSRWWEVVEARRMLDADGQGKVNGAVLDLYLDFGIGLDA